MAKYTLICEEKYDNSKVTVEFEANNIHNILPQFETFIRASGFSYMQGSLEFVDQSNNYENFEDDFELKYPESPIHGTDDISVGNMTYDENDYFDHNINFDEHEVTVSTLSILPENAETEYYKKCSVCGIDKNIMEHHVCYDKRCPKDTW